MIELLELTEAVLVATAVTMSVVVTPVAIITGEEIPDIEPLVELLESTEEKNEG